MGKKANTKLEIAMIGHKRIPSREGGVEELSKCMVKNGYSVTVYNRKGNNVSGKSLNYSNVKIDNYKGIKIESVITIEKND